MTNSDSLDIKVEETDISLSDLFEAEEVFCTGTAVQITPVGRITYQNEVYDYYKEDLGPITKKLKKTLTKMQRGEMSDPFRWLSPVIK